MNLSERVMTHTPGPWIAMFKSSMQFGNRVWIFSKQTKERVAMVHLEETSQEATANHYANARLIAAAPTQYEALETISLGHEEMIDYCIKHGIERGIANLGTVALQRHIAQAAIRAAKGNDD